MTPSTVLDLLETIRGFGPQPALVHRTDVRRFVWSYDALGQSADRMAVHLLRQGLRPGDRVLIRAPNSPYWVMALLGCLRAGIVAVPIDPRSPLEFLRAVQSQTEARLIVCGRFQPDPGLPVPHCFVDDLDAIVQESVESPLWPAVGEETLAEIVYTSGTTGTPKGVMLTHRNLSANLSALNSVLPREPWLRFLSLLPLSHMLEQQVGLLVPLARGGQVVYLETLKPTAILEALTRESILAVVAVPRLLQVLREQLQRDIGRIPGGTPLFHLLDSLAPHVPFPLRRLLFWPIHHRLGGRWKYLISGGAALEPDLERAWERLGFVVLQGYGLTEASPVVACNLPDAHRIGSVGRPLPEVAVRIAPDGEVLVRGPNVTPGYYCNPEATATAFTDGWLRTGDLGHFDADGHLYIAGRKREVIVTPAGVNVFPEDVEHALNQQPGVRDSCVVWWRGRIFAVLLPHDQRTFDPRQAVEQANCLLGPSQQTQGYTVWPFPDFPRTPLLKVRRAQVLATLPQLEAGEPGVAPSGVREPLTTVRQVLAQVAGLPVEQVRSDAALGLDLGLGSVERLAVASLLEQELNAEVDEDALTGGTRVREIERMVKEEPSPTRLLRIRRWTRGRLVALLRQAFWQLGLFPALRLVCRPFHVTGEGNLAGLEGPALFVSNHTSYLDAAAILLALPPRFRERLAPAAWAEYFEVPVSHPLGWLARRAAYEIATTLFNVFLLPHRRGFRASLRYAGELVDDGWNVLIFPEGTRTRTGEMNPFREGIGVFAANLKVPVVPLRVEGLFQILPPGARRLRPGPAAVEIGRPLWLRDSSYLELTRQIEDAVRSL
ncbi:MAG: AMP-binding protein [Chloroflexi bacterium]|nr:AMP-binding protein [Chloroflexota bacterium]